jgi:hypothetical protein
MNYESEFVHKLNVGYCVVYRDQTLEMRLREGKGHLPEGFLPIRQILPSKNREKTGKYSLNTLTRIKMFQTI